MTVGNAVLIRDKRKTEFACAFTANSHKSKELGRGYSEDGHQGVFGPAEHESGVRFAL